MIDCLKYWFAITEIKLTADQLTFLAIVIALSAYLATVRLFLIARLGDLADKQSDLNDERRVLEYKKTDLSQIKDATQDPARKRSYEKTLGRLSETSIRHDELSERYRTKQKEAQRNLLLLLLADIPMTLSAVLLGLKILYFRTSSSFMPASIVLFTFAGIALFLSHIRAWVETVLKYVTSRKAQH
jgi:hypothetical protein